MNDVVARLPGDDTVKALFNATPGPDLGEQVRAIFIKKIAGSAPGRFTAPTDYKITTSAQSNDYRNIFFPGWSPLPYTNEIAARSGLGDGWWSDYAVALLCQAAYHNHGLSQVLKIADIESAVYKAVTELHTNVVPFFVYLLGKQFSVSFDAFDRPKAKDQYIALLKAVVPVWDLALAQGQNKNPEWQLLHHFVKLSALGASTAEIKLVNGQLKGLGMPIPESLLYDRWTQHIEHLGKPVTYLDIDALASNGLSRNETVTMSGGAPIYTGDPYQPYAFDTPTTTTLTAFYAGEFANGPGKRFRK